MPKNKAPRKYNFTKTRSKGSSRKEAIIESIRQNVDTFENVFVFDYTSMRSGGPLKAIRRILCDSKITMAANTIQSFAIGRSSEDSYRPNLFKLSPYLRGCRALMFTDRTKKDIKQLFKRVRAADYAKMEDIAPRTFTIPKGPLDPSKYPVSMDPFLRKLGLTTKIEKGVVELTQDYVACRIGEPITADGARILKLWEQKLSEFHIGLVAHWQKSTEVAKHIKSEEAEAATTTMAAEED